MPPRRPLPSSFGSRWLLLGAVTAAAAVLVYALFLWPSEEDAVRAALLRLADAVEVREGENPVLRALRLQRELAEVLSEDVRADVPDLSEPLQSRREITALAAGSGSSWASARVSLGEMRIQIDKPRKRASARATATLTATEHGGRLRRDSRATSVSLEKVDGRWWIVSIEVGPPAQDEGLP